MKKLPLAKRCTCGCIESNHKHRDKSAKQLLEDAIRSKMIEPIHSPNSMGYLGFKPADPRLFNINKVWLPDEMLQEFERVRDEHSFCHGQMFKMCSCKRFQMDNLKYLEELSERSTS